MGEDGTATALVVDDDPTMRGVLRHLLEVEGWDVREASDGTEALLVYREGVADLVLTDLEMPGMGGEELARRIRDEDGEIPLVAISRRAPRQGAGELFDGILRKPVTRRQLRGWLAR